MPGMSELVILGTEELETRLEETRRELLNLRFQLATGQLDNTSRMGRVRKEVARILTLLREREIAEAEGAQLPDVPLGTEAGPTRSARPAAVFSRPAGRTTGAADAAQATRVTETAQVTETAGGADTAAPAGDAFDADADADAFDADASDDEASGDDDDDDDESDGADDGSVEDE
jgi:large subunit ribosomal protein L29